MINLNAHTVWRHVDNEIRFHVASSEASSIISFKSKEDAWNAMRAINRGIDFGSKKVLIDCSALHTML